MIATKTIAPGESAIAAGARDCTFLAPEKPGNRHSICSCFLRSHHYISEVARAKGRGRFVLLYELIFPIGRVCAGFLGSWVVPHFGWHHMFVIGALPAILAVFMQRLLPESLRWLAVQGRDAEAERALARID